MKFKFGFAAIFIICVILFTACSRSGGNSATGSFAGGTYSEASGSQSAAAAQEEWIAPEFGYDSVIMEEEDFSAGFDPSGLPDHSYSDEVYNQGESLSASRPADINKINNVTSFFRFIINNEKINRQDFNDDSFLFDNRTITKIDIEDNGNLTYFSSDINIVVHEFRGSSSIYKIIINPDSEYINIFPHKYVNEYLNDANFGEIQTYSVNRIQYSLTGYYNENEWIGNGFSLILYFNPDNSLYSAEIGFEMG